jgi:CNT family concentrative nucleoside transporter
MLLAFICIIGMLDWCLSEIHQLVRTELLGRARMEKPLTLSMIFGWLFAPIAWLMGVPWADCKNVGQLLGVRMVINEFVAYIELAKMDLTPRGYIIATYAFCGFANFSSIAIQIGGISTIAPSRRSDLAKLGLRAMLAATVASFLTANIAGALLSDEQMERDFRKNKARVAEKVEDKAKEYDAFLEKYPESSYAEEIRELKAKLFK